MRAATDDIVAQCATDRERVGSIAYEYLNWLGVLAGGWQWAITAKEAISGSTHATAFLVETAAFYAARVLPRCRMHEAAIRSASSIVTNVPSQEL